MPGPTAFEAWGLAASWVGSGAAVASVIIAAVFGYLTLANSRRSKRALDTATYAAAQEPAHADGRGVLPMGPIPVRWRIEHAGGQGWLLINDGTADAFDVSMQGLTATDRQRLTSAEEAGVVPAASALGFVYVSRLTLDGPGNLVVSWRFGPEAVEQSKVLRIPSP